MSETMVVVNEIFGPTFQGEGPSLGRRAGFVRLGRCDLSCQWCDTPYTWDWKGVTGTAYDPATELHSMAVADVVAAVDSMDVPLVVITGGEPLLQRGAVTALAGRFVERGHDVEIETNGRHRPIDHAQVRYNVSPKLSSSGDPEADRIRPDVLAALCAADAIFKFVAGDTADLDEVAAVAATARLADATLSRGWNLSTRLHVLAWGDERKR